VTSDDKVKVDLIVGAFWFCAGFFWGWICAAR
jgi:hypothetical protein